MPADLQVDAEVAACCAMLQAREVPVPLQSDAAGSRGRKRHPGLTEAGTKIGWPEQPAVITYADTTLLGKK